MDNLPNELHEMIASHLTIPDLRSYRLVNQRSEAIANRLLFPTVPFVFEKNLKGPFTMRPAIAQYMTQVHIHTKQINRDPPTPDKPSKLKKLIESLASAGATITELALELEEEEEEEDCVAGEGEKEGWDVEEAAEVEADRAYGSDEEENEWADFYRNGPPQYYTVEKYFKVLAACAPLLSRVTHFSLNTEDLGKGEATTQVALESLLAFMESLDGLRHMCLELEFRNDLRRLWTLFRAGMCDCLTEYGWDECGSLVCGSCCEECDDPRGKWEYWFEDQNQLRIGSRRKTDEEMAAEYGRIP